MIEGIINTLPAVQGRVWHCAFPYASLLLIVREPPKGSESFDVSQPFQQSPQSAFDRNQRHPHSLQTGGCSFEASNPAGTSQET